MAAFENVMGLIDSKYSSFSQLLRAQSRIQKKNSEIAQPHGKIRDSGEDLSVNHRSEQEEQKETPKTGGLLSYRIHSVISSLFQG